MGSELENVGRSFSSDVMTSDLAISANVRVNKVEEETRIVVNIYNTLKTTGLFENANEPVILTGGDSLIAESDGEIVEFVRSGDTTQYIATLGANNSGDLINIKLRRTNGFVDAQNTHIVIPALFSFNTPLNNTAFNLDDNIVFDWGFFDADGNITTPLQIRRFGTVSMCLPEVERETLSHRFEPAVNAPQSINLSELTVISNSSIAANAAGSNGSCSVSIFESVSGSYEFDFEIDPAFANNSIGTPERFPFWIDIFNSRLVLNVR